MNKLELIKERKSCRNYAAKKLKDDALEAVKRYTQRPYPIEENEMVEMMFLEDGKSVIKKLQGLAGYSGVMIEAPQYIALFSDNSEVAFRALGYLGEYILFQLFLEEIGSCWIHVNDSEAATKALGYEGDKALIALMAVGYPQSDSLISKMFSGFKANKKTAISDGGYADYKINASKEGNDYSSREATTSFVFLNRWGNQVSMDELEDRGIDRVFYYIKQAPSWGNRQPWKFILDGYNVIMAIEKNLKANYVSDNIDAGIAMYYFSLAMNEIGISGSWKTKKSEKTYDVPESHFIAGVYEIR